MPNTTNATTSWNFPTTRNKRAHTPRKSQTRNYKLQGLRNRIQDPLTFRDVKKR